MTSSAKVAWSLVLTAFVAIPLALAIPPGTEDEIRDRLEPFGAVCRAGDDCGTAVAAVAAGPLSGQQVYDQFCFACHATGVSEAPLFGDAGQWAPRIDKGMDTLVSSTVNGLNAMPPQGTCMSCSEDEIREAVQYMLDNI